MDENMERVDTVVIGAGQAGLATSYLLKQRGRDHVVLERENQVAPRWRERWDSFTLVTPNWQLRLPGKPYDGDDPDGFLTRDEVVGYLEEYAEMFDPPLGLEVEVTSVKRHNGGYVVQTPSGGYEASNVVVAVGTFQRPNIPHMSEQAPDHITQLHTSHYANPDELPDGAVLVVGSAQSGCQIATELNESGRDVYLATSAVGRIPRRYRGKDGMWWVEQFGLMDQTPDDLDDPGERFGPNPKVSGRNGGETLNLHHISREGVSLLGHLKALEDGRAIFATDLKENLAVGDAMADQVHQGADRFVEASGMDLPEEEVERPQDGYEVDPPDELDLGDVAVILWATGYRWDFSWIDLPIFDEWGYPIQDRGVTEYPGLYFVGLHFLHTRKSALLYGVGKDAEHIVDHIADG